MPLGIVKRIKEFITGKKDLSSGTRIVINCEKLENRVALLENGMLEGVQHRACRNAKSGR